MIQIIYRAKGKTGTTPSVITDGIEEALQEGVKAWVDGEADRLRANTGEIWPYDTGLSSRSFRVAQSGEILEVMNDTDYAKYVEAIHARAPFVEPLLEAGTGLDDAVGEAMGDV